MTMNFKLVVLATLLFSSAVLAVERTSYEGYKLVDIFPKTKEQIELISQLESNEDFDLWILKPEGGKAALSPEAFPKYAALFRIFGIEYEIIHNNLQERIDAEFLEVRNRAGDSRVVGKYATYSEIQSWMDDQALSTQAGVIVKTYIAGTSFQGRNLKVITIGTATSQKKIWIDCGIHAREWISPATCIYMIDALIRTYSTDAQIRNILSYYEIHVLPVVNPDGYDYSFTTRLWRKNRNVNANSNCIGVDLNRNYGYQWLTGGSSTNPCAEDYAGPRADSELETKAVQNAINRYLGQWDAFLTIHSFGQWMFTPYGYSRTRLPADYNEQMRVANLTTATINASGQPGWTFGSSAVILYVASGGSEDWAYEIAKIKYSYCLELRPGSRGVDSNLGFQLPADRIIPAGVETFAGLKTFLLAIKP